MIRISSEQWPLPVIAYAIDAFATLAQGIRAWIAAGRNEIQTRKLQLS